MKPNDITHSKFWLGDNAEDLLSDSSNIDLFKLAAYRRAIGNFVFILTGKIIPVKFVERSQSFATRKSVCIGGELSKGEFDSTVGLACHEAAHILYDRYFELVKTLWGNIPNSIYKVAEPCLNKHAVCTLCTELFNWVEDRYIDDFVRRTAPGYRGYYDALYDKYFYLPKITILLQSDEFRTPDLLSYRFRIINLVNHHSDLDALPGLREINDVLDVKNISRLTQTEDRLDMALRLAEITLREIVKGREAKQEYELPQPEGEHPKPSESIPEKSMKEALQSFDKQRAFVNGTVAKAGYDRDTIDKLDLLEEAEVDIVPVGGTAGVGRIECIVVRRMTLRLMESADFPFSNHMGTGITGDTGAPKSISISKTAADGLQEGISMGVALGRKLQIRGESRTTITPRQNDGKLDGRMLAEFGFGNEAIFYKTTTDQFKKAHLHLTVDASSSMEPKWKRTMSLVTALAKAVSMVSNLSISISFRGSHFDASNQKCRPYIVMAYDSRVDKFTKVQQLFPYLRPHGYTPEGLSFEAIYKEIPKATDELDSFFLNLSDGEPQFPMSDKLVGSSYQKVPAYNHTRAQIDKIRAGGIEVLSYFVEQELFMDAPRVAENMTAFRLMYGRDAQLIDIESVLQIAKTMNEKFLKKVDAS